MTTQKTQEENALRRDVLVTAHVQHKMMVFRAAIASACHAFLAETLPADMLSPADVDRAFTLLRQAVLSEIRHFFDELKGGPPDKDAQKSEEPGGSHE